MYRQNSYILIIISILLILILFVAALDRNQLGDINDDGYLNIVDVVFMIEIALSGYDTFSDDEIWASDVNIDGVTDVSDIIIIIEIILGLPDNCPPGYSLCDYNLSECCADSDPPIVNYSIYSLGIEGSYITDISMVSNQDIWVVGLFLINEEWSDRHNAAHWNGEAWTLHRITVPPYHVFSIPLSIFALSEDNIWIGMNVPLHFDGVQWSQVLPEDGWEDGWNFNGWITSIWGSNPDNLIFIGDNGSIARFDGSNYYPIASGTNIRLRDIDGLDSGNTVFISGWDYSGGSVVLQYEIINDTLFTLYTSDSIPNIEEGDFGDIKSLEVVQDTVIFSTASGLWKYNFETSESVFMQSSEQFLDGLNIVETTQNNQLGVILISTIGTVTQLYNNDINVFDYINDNYIDDGVVIKCGDIHDNSIYLAGFNSSSSVVFELELE